ncbi:MAG: 4a-hydroxytetrahydrobiopterin dehydratase [Cellvibrionaceae bacterium]
MSELSGKTCEACRADAPSVSKSEIDELMLQLDNWDVVEQQQIPQLRKVFSFKNFVEAIAFTNQVGEMAEAEGHHPALTTEWGRVEVRWWTHKIHGLHKNDFICAAKTDDLYSS